MPAAPAMVVLMKSRRVTSGVLWVGCVLLPEVPLESARVIAEKIRAIAEQTQTRHDDQKIRCTISVGISAFDAENATVDLLYKTADARLYEA